jgi:hypothetical protein
MAAVSKAFPGKTHDEKVYDHTRVVCLPWVSGRQVTENVDRTGRLSVGRPPDADARPSVQVRMVFTDLKPSAAAIPSLFEGDRQVTDLSPAMDAFNRKFGKHVVRFGGEPRQRGHRPDADRVQHRPTVLPGVQVSGRVYYGLDSNYAADVKSVKSHQQL